MISIQIEPQPTTGPQKIKTWFNNNRARLENGWKGGEGSGDDPIDQAEGGSDEEGQGNEGQAGGSVKANTRQSKQSKGKNYTIRDVAKQMWSDKIKKFILDEYGVSPTDPGFIGSYSGAVSKVIEQASQEEIKELENLVNEWNAQAVAEDIQQK